MDTANSKDSDIAKVTSKVVNNITPWIHKYKPKLASDIVGQAAPFGKLHQFVDETSKAKKKICIIYGGIGNGKTSSVHVLAQEKGLELFEINASDFRNKEAIESTVGIAVKQRSLFFKGKIILVDEIDGLSGQKDRGGLQTLLKMLDEAKFPVICTAQDPFDQKFSDLRKKASMIEYNVLDTPSVVQKLQAILDIEKTEYSLDALKALARRSGGDLRAAVNDTQVLTSSGQEALTLDAVKELDSHERARTETLIHALHLIFKTSRADVAMQAIETIEEDVDELSSWIVHNIPKEYHGSDLSNAFEWISKADVLKGRIMRWQHWRFLSYIFQMYSAGVAISKNEKFPGMVPYERPTRALKIWIMKNKYASRSAVAEKIAEKTHTSKKRVISDVMPYLRYMCMHDSKTMQAITTEYDLTDDEQNWFRK